MSESSHSDSECSENLENSLCEVVQTTSLKWIFVGGKGGVGKTTTSCSIAIQLAQRRESVLILSTDPAHNLSDAFRQKFTNTPTLVNGFQNLYAMEIDPSPYENFEMKINSDDEKWAKLIPELTSALPGIDEALSFAQLMHSVQNMKYSTIVFDTAPTGHTLRLLSFPDLLEKGLKKVSALKEKMSGALQMVNMISTSRIDEEEIHSRLDALRAVTTVVKETFKDASQTTFICVCIPEFLSLYETERLVQDLMKQGITCRNLVVNQVLFPLPECDINTSFEVEDLKATDENSEKILEHLKNVKKKCDALEAHFTARRCMQSKYLKTIDDLYASEFHLVFMEMETSEVRGIDKLKNFGAKLLSERTNPRLRNVTE